MCWRGIQRLFDAGYEFLLAMGAAIQEMMTEMNAFLMLKSLGGCAGSDSFIIWMKAVINSL